MEKVLVTGANGFLAGNIIMELLSRGLFVRGMLRSSASMKIKHANLELFHGNITEKKDVFNAVEGCKIVIHSAAVTDQSLRDYFFYKEVNSGGTENIIEAGIGHNIKKLIYVSTANAFAFGSKEEAGTEGDSICPPFIRSGYARSKNEAQNKVLERFRGPGRQTVVVNPTFMIGPDDNKISSNRIILRALNKRILFIPPGGKNFIHVKDVAKGICNAIELGENGECYILANENLSYREFHEKMGEVTNHKPFLITIPGPLLLLTGLAGSVIRFAGINTSLSLTNMRILSIGNYYSAKKAVKYLNLPQTPVKKAIEDTISWFKKEKITEKA